jgi:hypothetical protein
MKPFQKLSLKRETLMNLNPEQAAGVAGGMMMQDPPNTKSLCPISNGRTCETCGVTKCAFSQCVCR